jgi:hypothetical protein
MNARGVSSMGAHRSAVVVCLLACLFLSIPLVSSDRTKITRKDELILEGIIHDYFHRNRIKQNFVTLKFEAYATVSLQDIMVTVHVDQNDLQEVETVFDILKTEIQKGITSTILSFPDFEWAKSYRFTVNLRTGRLP